MRVNITPRTPAAAIRSEFKGEIRAARSLNGRAIEYLVNGVHRRARRLIKAGPKTGVIYQRYKPRRVHQASAPGQPPADDLGNLRRSIKKVLPRPGTRVTGAVGTNSPYARILEFGGFRIRPRPFLRRARREQLRLLPAWLRAQRRRR